MHGEQLLLCGPASIELLNNLDTQTSPLAATLLRSHHPQARPHAGERLASTGTRQAYLGESVGLDAPVEFLFESAVCLFNALNLREERLLF